MRAIKTIVTGGLDNRNLKLLNLSKTNELFLRYQDFIIRWQNAEGPKPVGDAFGWSANQASSLADKLRKNGIPLRRFILSKEEVKNLRAWFKTLPPAKPLFFDFKRFCRLWNSAPTFTAFCTSYGISKATARQRAMHLRRKLHIPLKKFPRNIARGDH